MGTFVLIRPAQTFYERINIDFLPKTVQQPHPPIWIGGESPPALRRTGRLADMWYPISSNPRHPMGTLEQVSDGFSRVRRHAEKAGRDPSEIGLAYNTLNYSEPDPSFLPNGERRSFTGAPEQIAEDIRAWEGLGTSYLMFVFHRNLETDRVEEILGRMERFATRVKPLV